MTDSIILCFFSDNGVSCPSLQLRRAPMFLRVVYDRKAKAWDALDQLDDEPKEDELIFAFQKTDNGTVHVDKVVKGRRVGEWHHTAHYDLVQDQPDDYVMRDSKSWQEWALAESERVNLDGI